MFEEKPKSCGICGVGWIVYLVAALLLALFFKSFGKDNDPSGSCPRDRDNKAAVAFLGNAGFLDKLNRRNIVIEVRQRQGQARSPKTWINFDQASIYTGGTRKIGAGLVFNTDRCYNI